VSLKRYIYRDDIDELSKRAVGRGSTHLVGPSEASLLLPEGIVVFLADFVASLEDDKTTIVITTRGQVHETLDASETGTLRICRNSQA